MQYIHLITAYNMALIAYSEIKGQMEGKMFVASHYALSCIIAFWQFYPTSTLVGRLFFMLPHFFTAYSTYIVLKDHEKIL